ncbi:PREDICTED: uroplakin-3b-like, partial [Nestor notabilis]|uniref:uroplakin-3b-like n=1 Tax=Nestor notabilis TaxID=176057 RepID=UPI000523B49E
MRDGVSTCSPPAPPALLPYVPRVPTTALPGKLTATTFALERPCCIFDHQADASDAVWTLETPVRAFACSAPSPALLRVGGDTECGAQEPCNGPLPSPGPYRVKFLVMGCHGPKAETRWSDPILLRR